MIRSNLSLLPKIIAATEKPRYDRVSIAPVFQTTIFPRARQSKMLGDCKLLNVRNHSARLSANASAKRAFDIRLPCLTCSQVRSCCLRSSASRSPAGRSSFRQDRVGKKQKLFKMYKFPLHARQQRRKHRLDDRRRPRKTHFGSFIRKDQHRRTAAVFQRAPREMMPL